jgi:hypothetical protein
MSSDTFTLFIIQAYGHFTERNEGNESKGMRLLSLCTKMVAMIGYVKYMDKL